MTVGIRHVLGIGLLALALAVPAAQKGSKQAEQDLKAVTENIERIQRQVARDTVERDRASRDLRAAETSVASVSGELHDLQDRRAERAAARQKLQEQRTAREAELERDRQDLARQLRAAYLMGHDEPLKLLLNQRDPGEVSRMLAYYGYFGRLRARQMDLLKDDVARIADLSAKIDAEDAELARLEGQQKDQLGQLQKARQQRGRVLASLEKESRSRAAQLEQLQKQRQALEDLVNKLARATESVPFDANAPFSRARGTLPWPVAGSIAVDFGEAMAGGLRSKGIEIEAPRGADVRAVHEGRVLFADWVNGSGLLIILDHGNGYFSLYGHNEQLYRKKLDTVQAGETIATVGDSGGRKTPGLYFEITRASKPVDPHAWFRTREPPPQ